MPSPEIPESGQYHDSHPVTSHCPVKCLGLPVRAYNALRSPGRTIADIQHLLDRDKLKDVRGLGKTGQQQVTEAMRTVVRIPDYGQVRQLSGLMLVLPESMGESQLLRSSPPFTRD